MPNEPRQWPEGRLNADDDGQCKIAIGSDMAKKVVIMAFEIPTKWVGFPPALARELAANLIKHAQRIDGK